MGGGGGGGSGGGGGGSPGKVFTLIHTEASLSAGRPPPLGEWGGRRGRGYRCNRNKTRAARSGVFCLNMEAADLKLRSGALMSLSGCGRGLNGQRSEVRAAPLSGGKREDGFYRCYCIFPLEIKREPCRVCVAGGGGG